MYYDIMVYVCSVGCICVRVGASEIAEVLNFQSMDRLLE